MSKKKQLNNHYSLPLNDKNNIKSNQRNSNISPNKKKPFISTSKSIEVFGDLNIKTKHNNKQTIDKDINTLTIDELTLNENITKDINPNIVSILKQSIRWMNLSIVLYKLTISQTNREIITKDSYLSFLDSIQWRAKGTITSDEFTMLYNEWINKQKSNYKQRNSINLLTFRCLLIDRKCSNESDLDLYTGMILNEINKQILHLPISFKHNSFNHSLDICTQSWINDSEELFFLLDSSGYGILYYDEIFFLSICLTIGLQGWTNESDLIDDLSLTIVTSTALQIIRDMQTINNSNSYGITLNMFKNYLLKKLINESSLNQFVNYMKTLIEKFIRLLKSKLITVNTNSDIDYQFYLNSCYPIDNQETIGSTRLWEKVVLLYTNSSSNYSTVSPIQLFLLSDSYKYISYRYLTIESNDSNVNNNLIQDLTYVLYDEYIKWYNSMNLNNLSNQIDSNDPIYQIISHIIIQYKHYCKNLCQLFIDLVISYYSPSGQMDITSSICASIIPNIENMLIELGYNDNNKQVVSFESNQLVDELVNESIDKLLDIKLSNNGLILVNTNTPISVSRKVKFTSLFDYRNSSTIEKTDIRLSNNDNNKEIVEKVINSKENKRNSVNLLDSKAIESHIDYNKELDRSTKYINTNKSNDLETKQEKTNNTMNDADNREDTTIDKFLKQLMNDLIDTNNPIEQNKIIETMRIISKVSNKLVSSNRDIPISSVNHSKSSIYSSPSSFNDEIVSDVFTNRDSLSSVTGKRKKLSNSTIDNLTTNQLDIHVNNKDNNDTIVHTQPNKIKISAIQHVNDRNTDRFIGVSSDRYSDQGSVHVSDLSVNSSYTLPSYIKDLYPNTQPGQYARSLREILRKMPNDESHLPVKSLEQILKLGNEIVQHENSKSIGSNMLSKQINQQINKATIVQPKIISKSINNGVNKSKLTIIDNNNSKIPGFMPNEKTGKKLKKQAFGHPVV